MQWWYGHNAVAFFLTTPFLGLMYYYLPKAAERPVFSYRLSIMHFWSLVFVYIWAGPHHLHYSAVPEWASTLGMLFSLILWMPSWGGMVNGFFTLRGAWHKVREDPILKFMVVAVTYYGMSTFEGPMMSIKSVNAVSHFTDWTIGHVHAGALGWNAFLSFGILYWVVPRLWKTQLYSTKLATFHFWVATVGLIAYQVSMWVAGITQWAMWRAFEPDGRLVYPDFIETVIRIVPMYWVRLVGGLLFFSGLLAARAGTSSRPSGARRPTTRSNPRSTRPRCVRDVGGAWRGHRRPTPTTTPSTALQHAMRHGVHRLLEERTSCSSRCSTALALAVGSLVETTADVLQQGQREGDRERARRTRRSRSSAATSTSREGCYNCHSQMVRPFRYETERYGEYSKAGEFVYDHPFQWGSKRTGPDLHRVGGKYPSLWHVRHMAQPDSTTPGSIMPRYPAPADRRRFDTSLIGAKMRALRTVGVPYTDGEIDAAVTAMQRAGPRDRGRSRSAAGPDRARATRRSSRSPPTCSGSAPTSGGSGPRRSCRSSATVAPAPVPTAAAAPAPTASAVRPPTPAMPPTPKAAPTALAPTGGMTRE